MSSNDITVAYPGREGAHSAAACDRLFPAARVVPQASFFDVVEAVTSGLSTYGVLPIESSLVGPVNETHDLLYDSALSIVAEAILPIRHCLVGPMAVPLEEVREIRSHPVALDQCRGLLASLPWATAVVSATTGDAAAAVAELGDPSVAAIASARAARMHGLVSLADDVGDHDAYTRFAALAPYTRLDRRDGGSTWSSSSPARSRRGRSTTASTACSAATRWTRTSPLRSRSSARRPPGFASSAPTAPTARRAGRPSPHRTPFGVTMRRAHHTQQARDWVQAPV